MFTCLRQTAWEMEVPTPMASMRLDNVIRVRRLSLLKYRDFRRLTLVQVFGQISDATASVITAGVLLFGGTSGPTVTRLVSFVLTSSMPLVLAGPLAGILADRVSRRCVLAVGQVIRSLLVAAVGLTAAFGIPGVAFVLWGTGMCVTRVLYTARVASIRHVVRDHELVAAGSLSLALGTISGAIGGSVAVVFMNLVGPKSLIVPVVGHLIAASSARSIAARLGGGSDHVSASWSEVFTYLRAPKSRFAILSTSAHRITLGVILATVLIAGDQAGGGSPLSYAAVLGSAGLGTFAGTNSAEWVNERFPRRVMTVLVFVFSALVASIMVAFESPIGWMVSIAMLAFLSQNLRVCSDATIQSNAISGSGGRAFAFYDICHNLAYLAGIVLGLVAFEAVGGSAQIAVTATLLSTCAIMFGMMRRDAEEGTEIVERDPTCPLSPSPSRPIVAA
jgi:MFS family permease